MTRSRVPWLVLLVLVAIALAVWVFSGSDSIPLAEENRAKAGMPAESTAGEAGQEEEANAPHETAPPRTAVDPLLGPGACGARGRLLRGDEPVVGAEIRAVGRDPEQDPPEATTSDAEGRFALALSPTQWRLEVSGPGIPRGWSLGGIRLDVARVFDLGDIRVPKSARVIGRVIDEAGQPLRGVQLFLRLGDGLSSSKHPLGSSNDDLSARSDTRGRFAFEGLLADEGELLAEHARWGSRTKLVRAFSGGVADLGDLVMWPARHVRGFVVDPSGAPVVGARVIPGGGAYEGLRPRHAVVTDARGMFVLRNDLADMGVTVQKAGFEPEEHDLQRKAQPVRVTLGPANALGGRVIGAAGLSGTFRVDDFEYGHNTGSLNALVIRDLGTWLPLAEDGSFHLGHLPRGSWTVSARVPGLGSVGPVRIELPLAEPLELTTVPDRQVEVTVVNDRGEPVPHARVVRVDADDSQSYGPSSPEIRGRGWFGQAESERARADERGRATFCVPTNCGLALTANAPMHGFTSVYHAPEQVPASVQLVLPRTGAITGRVADASLGRHTALWAGAAKIGEPKRRNSVRIDASGAFTIAPLPPGRYQLGITLSDASCDAFYEPVQNLSVFEAVPLLTAFESVVELVEVEVLAGEVTEVELPTPVAGEVRGRVLAGGRPVEGAIVFGYLESERGDRGLDSLHAHDLRLLPRDVTGPDGRFRFFLAVDQPFELRARGATAPAWCAPVRLSVGPGEVREQDILLSAAAIHGRYDLGDLAPFLRELCRAQLCPFELAGEDPFAQASRSAGLFRGLQEQTLRGDGTFSFEGLPSGRWILRVVGYDELYAQQVVTVTGDETFELGLLAPPRRVSPQLECGLGSGFGTRWLRVVENAPEGVFVRSVSCGRKDPKWPAVAPGRYKLLATESCDSGFTFVTKYKPTGDSVDLEVHEDGTCTPAVVWPEGLAK